MDKEEKGEAESSFRGRWEEEGEEEEGLLFLHRLLRCPRGRRPADEEGFKTDPSGETRILHVQYAAIKILISLTLVSLSRLLMTSYLRNELRYLFENFI